jgi:myo-inositol 2-dehydrogenase/D-chiro-inositol 1-dehydrogenase
LTEALAVGEIDVASVCSPPAAHLESVRELIGSGVRAIWAEKPLSTDAESAAELTDACATNGVALQVNFLRRFDPAHKALAERGIHVRHADFRYSGDLLNYGSHALDLFRWLVGEPASVSARTLPDREPEVTLTTAAGSTGSLIQVPSGRLDLFDCRLYTDDGGVLITALGEQVVNAQVESSPLFTGVERAQLGEPQPGTLERAMLGGADSLVACLDRGAPLPCDGSDGVAAMRLYEAAMASLDSGRPTILTEQ